MADTNITELRPGPVNDPTNALRQRRHRKRKARSTVTARAPRAQNAHVEKPNDFKSDVTVSAGRWNVADVTAYVAAFALAGAAAWFSIRGMVVLFPGAPMSVVGMAIAMEGAKLVTAGWLARRWRGTAWVWRFVLAVLVAGLAIINAAGVYAQLVAAHVGERGAAQSAIETQDAALAARIEVAAHSVADLDRRLGQIDTAIEEAAKRGRTNAALSAIAEQRKAREALTGQRRREGAALADLKTERARVRLPSPLDRSNHCSA
jgi:hypothetical protein